MTDLLEKVKQKIERLNRQIEVRSGENFHDESKTVLIFEERLGVYEDLLPDISSLITTIESQKEEIELIKFQLEVFVKANDAEYETRFQLEEANTKIESLKAITELAVKMLRNISTGRYTGKDCELSAISALSEIERLQNAQT